MARCRRDPQREQFWRDVLRRQVGSRLSVAEFCRRERLSQPSFYAWRRTIAQRDQRQTIQRRDEENSKRSARQPAARMPKFLPVHVSGPALREAALTLELPAGLVLRLPESISIQRLAELLSALESQRCVNGAAP